MFKQHVDEILKSTEQTSSEDNHSEQSKTGNCFNFPSSTDEYHPLPKTNTSGDYYPSRDRQPPDRFKLQLGKEYLWCTTIFNFDIIVKCINRVVLKLKTCVV